MNFSDYAPQEAIAHLVNLIEPLISDMRVAAAVILFGAAAVRPKVPSICAMIGRVLVLVACVLWGFSIVPGLAPCATVGNWVAFASLFSTYVCELVMHWPQFSAAKQAEGPDIIARLWTCWRQQPRKSNSGAAQ